MHSSLPIIILAAGLSSRMRGRDKLMEPIDGTSLLVRQVGRARAATNGPVLVALPPPPHTRHDALEHVGVERIAVPDAGAGISASLRTALCALAPQTPAVMILLPDLPDITTEDMRRVMSAIDLSHDDCVWRGTTADGKPGHPVVIAAPLFAEFKRLSGDSGGSEILKRYRSRTCLVPLPGDRARLDLDTPEDWAAWRAARNETEAT
ncbi:MAG: nucleotidyltransferase family protein [Roseobacter sp.]|jgi:CTP:molybdopterin cytidylyltransferase MocA